MAAPLALLVTAPAVALGVLAAEPAARDLDRTTPVARAELELGDRAADDVSRSGSRSGPSSEARKVEYVLDQLSAFERREKREATRAAQEAADRVARAAADRAAARAAAEAARAATVRAIGNADTTMWTTTALNLWSAPEQAAASLGVLDGGEQVLVTGRAELGRVEIVLDARARWVTAGYLSDEKPEEPEERPSGVGGACTNGTSVSGGANVLAVHQAVCAAFPSITSYGTYRAGSSDHASGRAIDVMVSGSAGWAVAEFVRANYAQLGVSYVIHSQNIWSVDRGGEGWRGMADRGSTTANHYDHVHVSTY